MKACVNGLELEYEVMGEGEPLVLIMGIGTQLIHWPEGFCQLLAERGFQVIRFDNRDVGLSSKMHHLGRPPLWRIIAGALFKRWLRPPYTLEDMAADAASLIEVLGLEDAHVTGISMGGMIAQTLAITHPHRVRTLTSLASAPSIGFPSEPHAMQALLTRPAKTRAEAQSRGVAIFKAIGSPDFDLDEDELAEISGRAWDRDSDHRGFVRQLAAIICSGSRERALHRLAVPSLVIHGSRDPLIPPAAGRATAHAIPGARLELIEGMGHDLPRECWPQIADAIAWNSLI